MVTHSKSSDKSCSVEGCAKQFHAKGYCKAHLYHFHKHGDPLGGGTSPGTRLAWLEVYRNYNGDDCLLWPFDPASKRYGSIQKDGKHWSAHRLMCTMVNGPAPTSIHQAAHLCGKGHLGCVNPKHLAWKTSVQNHADRLLHGTDSRGEKNGRSKLVVSDVLAIRAAVGVTQQILAKKFGVGQTAISQIRAN